MLMGIGGTPEGVISAAALKCVGGAIQGKLWPRDDDERQQLVDAGSTSTRVLTTDDLVAGEDVFVAATGVTTGALLRGVRYTADGAITDSIVMRSRSGHGPAAELAADAMRRLRQTALDRARPSRAGRPQPRLEPDCLAVSISGA